MLTNYQYFLVLAEELNISNAARRLFISHQCLSKYLKGLEEEYGVTFFERKPKFTLTQAGQIMYETLRKVELTEHNLNAQLNDIKQSKKGLLRFGITEGRYPIVIPRLIKHFHALYPEVELAARSMTSAEMQEKISNNALDLFFAGTNKMLSDDLKCDIILKEDMYLVISDNLLKQYLPDQYPACKEQFLQGADLRLFHEVPFVLNHKGFNSRDMLDRHLDRLGISLNCVNEISTPDIHHRLAAEDYAASFCLTMYLPSVYHLNKLNTSGSKLNIFPIADFHQHNDLALIYHKNKLFPAYVKDFMRLVREHCSLYSSYSIENSLL